MSEYNLSDIRAATNNNDGFMGGNNFGWFIALMVLFGGGFGWGNNRGNVVTEADLCNANSFSELKAGVRDVSGQISDMNIGLTKGLCDMGYTMLAQFNNVEKILSDCCCQTLRAVDSIKFDMANYAAATNQMFAAGVQSIKDMFRDYQEQNMRDENMKNYFKSELCGVVRYPTMTAYATDCNPFFGYNNRGGCC